MNIRSSDFSAEWKGIASGVSIILLAALLSGCASRDAAPPAETASLAVSVDVSVKGPEEPAVKPPEPTGGPLTLDRAIEDALRASPELDQMRFRTEAAAEQERQAESAFYPRLVLAEEYNATDNPVYALMNIINQRRFRTNIDFNNPGEQQNFSSQARAEWSIFEGGSKLHDWRAAGETRRSTKAEAAAARNRLVAKVTETYYRWLQSLNFISVAERVLESAKMDEQLGEARVKAEMALPSELMRLKARTAEMNGDLVSAKTGARRLQAALERFMARPVRPGEIPESAPPPPPFQGNPADNPDALVKQALDKRPEMVAAKAMILAARERVESAKGGFLPKIGTGIRYEWDTENFGRNAESWFAGVQASWPIFDGGLTIAKFKEAKSRLEEMEARGRQMALDIALEVNQAALAVGDALEKVKVAEERKKWAETALHEVRRQYRDQVLAVDALFQAEAAWSRAETAYASALFEAGVARALLMESLGGFADWMEARNG